MFNIGDSVIINSENKLWTKRLGVIIEVLEDNTYLVNVDFNTYKIIQSFEEDELELLDESEK